MKLLIAILLVFFVDYTHPTTADVTLVVSKIKKVRGHLRIGVYDKKETWLQNKKEVRFIVQEVRATTMKIVIKNLPLGEYGISVYHDMDDNKEFNKNFLGLPAEPYCFSNNYKPFMSKPKFDDVKFKVSEKMTLYLQLVK